MDCFKIHTVLVARVRVSKRTRTRGAGRRTVGAGVGEERVGVGLRGDQQKAEGLHCSCMYPTFHKSLYKSL